VKLRDEIKQGQTVALVRYMGMNHEIHSDVSGKLVEILIEDGQAIVYGQPLFRLK
jgi:biotin carboxyl carrier protein